MAAGPACLLNSTVVDEIFDEFLEDAEVVDSKGLEEVNYEEPTNYLSTATTYVTSTYLSSFLPFLT